MDKTHTFKIKWHIIVIIVMISALSIASWIQFSKQVKPLIGKLISDQKETSSIGGFVSDFTAINVFAATKDKNQAARHFPGQKLQEKTEALCGLIDKSVNKIDSLWSVYNKKRLSNIDIRITYLGTGEISSVQVLSGKGKWLFYIL